jgi:hypothetical protein
MGFYSLNAFWITDTLDHMCPRIRGYSASSIPMFDSPRDVAVVEYT